MKFKFPSHTSETFLRLLKIYCVNKTSSKLTKLHYVEQLEQVRRWRFKSWSYGLWRRVVLW